MSRNYYNPNDYSIDDAFKDLLVKDNNVTDVTWIGDSLYREYTYSDGSVKITECTPEDNEKGHNQIDYHYNTDGHISGIGWHKTNT